MLLCYCTVMEDAIEAVKIGKISLRQAAKDYNVSRSTLKRRLEGMNSGKVGRPTKFTTEDETGFANLLMSCAAWGVPISIELFRKVVMRFGLLRGTVQYLTWLIDSLICSSLFTVAVTLFERYYLTISITKKYCN